ncbi:MAG: YqgE/AlgH family protein [Actinomycetes bacterium]
MTDLSLTGRLLVASPMLGDPNFERSVVLLVDHDEEGALGVVLNRPTGVEVAVVIPSWGEYTTGPALVFRGGPVGEDSALALGALAVGVPDDEAEEPLGFRRVFGSLGLVDLDAEPEVLAADLRAVRVFAGYAGWGPGQLEDELAEDTWFVVESLPGDPFVDDPDHLWRDVLRRQGGELAMVATFPEDPSLN